MLRVRNLARRLAGLVASPPRPPSPPHPPSTATFQTIDPSQPIEEETLPWYNPKDFYPVRVGEVFRSRYQVVGKLGYGAYSTVWLCRDPVEHRYVSIKVCTRDALPVRRELAALRHLDSLPRTNHAGRQLIRTLLDDFTLTLPGEKAASSQSADPVPSPSFQCLVHKPMLMSLFVFRHSLRGKKFTETFLKVVLRHVLLAVDYLHSEAKVIHADIQEKNILLDLDAVAALETFDEAERTSPLPRKTADDRTIYLSGKIVTEPVHYGRPVLCDFGETRFGATTYTDFIQPFQYRAPEVVLRAPWDEKVDIWTVGVMVWNMFEDKDMFTTDGGPENKEDDLYHLAHMVSLLGPPPVDLLKRGNAVEPYFDEEGNWIGETSLPDDSLEQSERNLEGEDKALFLAFIRKMVTWKPEDRCSAKELLSDAWLNKGV